MTPARNVLHVARAPQTGVWSMMRQLALWQRDQGYRVGLGLLLPASWPDSYRAQAAEVRAAGVEILQADSPDMFGTGAILYHQFANPISHWARTFACDGEGAVIHFHNAWLSGAYMPVRARNATAVVTYHGIQGERPLRGQPLRRRLHASWARRLVAYGAKHASVDVHNTHVAQDLFGVEAGLFTVIANGTAPAPDGLAGCPRLADPSKPFTIGHVGVVDEGKGWWITAEAVLRLDQKGHRVRYLIAGTGPETEKAKSWCEAHPGIATFLAHSRNPVAEVFPRLDALSLPSRSEGLPMAVLESIALGVPVIATRVGALPQVIGDGDNGFLIERSSEALEGALARLIANPELHRRLSQEAKATHAARYSTATMGAAYERLYFGAAALR